MRKIVLMMLFTVILSGMCFALLKKENFPKDMDIVHKKIFLKESKIDKEKYISASYLLYRNKKYVVTKIFKRKYKADRKFYENNIFTGGPFVSNKYKMYNHKTGRYEKEKEEEAIRFKVPLSKKSKEYLRKYIKKYGLYIHKMIVIGKDIFLVHQTTKKVFEKLVPLMQERGVYYEGKSDYYILEPGKKSKKFNLDQFSYYKPNTTKADNFVRLKNGKVLFIISQKEYIKRAIRPVILSEYLVLYNIKTKQYEDILLIANIQSKYPYQYNIGIYQYLKEKNEIIINCAFMGKLKQIKLKLK